MKSFIIPIAIIVALIAFFIIVDRKEFSRHENVQTVQRERPSTNTSVSVSEKKPVTDVKPSVEIKPTEEQPVDETKQTADSKPVTNAKTDAEAKRLVTETKSNETKTVVKTKSAKANPVAIPVLSPEEAVLLAEKQEQEREEAKKRGWVFYEEIFVSTIKHTENIQQTNNWKFVSNDSGLVADSRAKKEDFFTIESETPLEYDFVLPLFEHTLYAYRLSCSVRGNGKVVLSSKEGNDFKEFSIDSNLFETVLYPLGDGSSLNKKIIPTITFQGNLQVESITLFQKELNNQRTVCLGSIEAISNVPDIKKSNYPDCYYTAKLVVKEVLDGQPAPQNIQLLIPAFLNNKIDPLSTIMEKGGWKVSIRPFSLATKEEQEIEQVDEIETYLYTPYILVAAETADINPGLTESGIPILEGESYVSPFDNPVNPPLPDIFVEDSKNEIRKELSKVNTIIEQVEDEELINAKFQSAWNEKQKKYDSLNSTMIWAREQDSFFALPKKWELIPSETISEDNLNAIVELDHLFKSNGIQFIIQIVPDYRDIAALVLNPEFQKYGDQRSARVAKKLLDRGVETQYISDEIVKNAFNYERLFFYPNDFHPDEGTTDIMTTLIAHRLGKFGDLLSHNLSVSLFSKEQRDTGFGDNLKWPEGVDTGSHEAGSNVQVPYILYNKQILDSNPQSNILVFGNSFAVEPMTKNAYISYLAPKILHNCSSATMGGVSVLTALPQLFISSPDKYFKNKQIAVLPISITYLTEKRFNLLNVTIMDERLKEISKSEFITSLPLKQEGYPIYSPSFNFTYRYLSDYLPSRTSCIALSKSHSIVKFSIPDGTDARKVRFSIQPLFNYGVSVLVNGKDCTISSQHTPKWEVLEVDINKTSKNISIELDISNCTSPDAKVLIGNVSLFE